LKTNAKQIEEPEPRPPQSLQVVPQAAWELSTKQVTDQMQRIRDLMKAAMKEDHHYGVIPGTDKKTLLKPGAEMLGLMFRFVATYLVQRTDLPNNHREYDVTCTLTHGPSGTMVATGEGACSTMEKKYRWRKKARACPECGVADCIIKSKRAEGWYCFPKKGGCGKTFAVDDDRITDQEVGVEENPDVADVWNTAKKIACKRALVAATLSATACSDIFEHAREVRQDEPEDEDEGDLGAPPPRGKQQSQQPKTTPKQEQPKPTQAQERARECGKMASELGLDAAALKAWLAENGVPNFDRWGQLDEPTLLRVHALLMRQLQGPDGGGPDQQA